MGGALQEMTSLAASSSGSGLFVRENPLSGSRNPPLSFVIHSTTACDGQLVEGPRYRRRRRKQGLAKRITIIYPLFDSVLE
eukprot:scaffold593_cov126-Cylindrotheca_fusiformis.AAC.6